MNWGKGLALALAAFAGMMTYFMVRGAQSPEPLIAENYYEQELAYQDRIDATHRADVLSSAVTMAADRSQVQVGFPAEMLGKSITGTLELIRLNNASADRKIALRGTATEKMQAAVDLLPGVYIAQLTWTIDRVEYFREERLFVP